MKNSIIIRVVILGAFSVMGILAVQTFWVLRSWDLKDQEFDEKAQIALLNVAKDLEKLGSPLPPQNLISQLSSNYYAVNINDIINANLLEYYLIKELELVGLKEDFEYGIYDCSSNKMVYGNYISYASDKPSAVGKRDDLPSYDEYLYYFGVRFPSRTSHLLSSMRVTITFSILLLLTVLFFIYTTYIILRQKRLSEMQKDFINNMTHEFKTPISTIKLSANTFLGHPTIKADSRLMQYARIINDQNERLNSQVEKVLQLARIERDNFKLNKEPIVLHDLLLQIGETTKMKVHELGGHMDLQLNATTSTIKADKLHFTNLMHNLIDNAIKYSKEHPEITIKTSNENNYLRLSICDKGIGIPKDSQGKVFEKFYRVPTGNVHNVKGFGLGLYYIKNVVNTHGWKIHLESEEGQGTNIHIDIPVKKK